MSSQGAPGPGATLHGTLPTAQQQPQFQQPTSQGVLNSNAQPFVPGGYNAVYSNSEVSPGIANSMLLAALSLPQPEVPKFKGDLTMFHAFMTAFDTRVAQRATSNADRLYFLDQYLEGEPKELISSCFHQDAESGYLEARNMLVKEYGDSYKLSMVYLSKLFDWQNVKPDDCIALRKLSLFLTKCLNVMKTMSDMYVLNHPHNLMIIVQKLPTYLQNKWRDQAGKARRSLRAPLQFEDLVSFVVLAADTANDPVYGRDAVFRPNQLARHNDTKAKNERFGKSKQKTTTLATAVNQEKPKPQSNANSNSKSKCPLCQQSHDLDDCGGFLKKDIDERREFLKEQRLCFGCYGRDHMSKGCVQKHRCKTCQKRHPTALHVEGFTLPPRSNRQVNTDSNNNSKPESIANPNNTGCAATSVPESVILHGLLPVKIKQQNSDKIISTYCFYDSGSSGSFITDSLHEKLGSNGTNVRLQLKTMHGDNCIDSAVVYDLTVTDMEGNNPVSIPKAYTRDAIPIQANQIPRKEMLRKWEYLQQVAADLPEYRPELEIGILLGNNCPNALEPLEVVPAQGTGPFATKLRHGWTVYGPLRQNEWNDSLQCNRIAIHETCKEVMTPLEAMSILERDFNEYPAASHPDELGLSMEDRQFLKIVQEGTTFANGHYCVPLPFRVSDPKLPDNRVAALKRAKWQHRKLSRDEAYHREYTAFIQKMLDRGYAEQVPTDSATVPGKSWFLPHHAVFNENKGKIRVVFDGSAVFQGTSLNSELLQGPDLANNLVGVLSRFRQDQVAIVSDIEAMFYQINVPTHQRSFLKFLWWPGGDLTKEMTEYQMTVHLFGAASSPSVANFILKTAGEQASNPLISRVIKQNFYVDDCLCPVESAEVGKSLVRELRETCKASGFHLTKFISNSEEVLQDIPKEELSKEVSQLDLNYDNLVTRTLGIQWSVGEDCFGFKISPKPNPETRRGILSTVSSLYDPLGFVAPVILPAKGILQDLCREPNIGWDDPVPEEHRTRWTQWLSALKVLEEVRVQRCLKPPRLNSNMTPQLLVFSDASSTGYGSVAYMRTQDDSGMYHIGFVAGKARLAPLKVTSIPRLELTAAVTSVRLASMMKRELDEELEIIYFTDSTTVLRFIANNHRRFPVFVANRVRLIRDFSEPAQWQYVPTDENPADEASRGLPAEKLAESKWLRGPEFLKEDESKWPTKDLSQIQSSEEVPETSLATVPQEASNTITKLISYYSNWHKLRSAVAIYRKVFNILKDRVQSKDGAPDPQQNEAKRPTVKDLEDAELALFRWLHQECFTEEMNALQSSTEEETRSRAHTVSKASPLYRLDPYAKDGIIHVGGRLSRAPCPESTKHPIILPKKSHLTKIIIQYEHSRLGHAGRNHVLASLRERFWIIGGISAVRNVISTCVTCRKTSGSTVEQKMANLPAERLDATEPPFTFTGVDYFGPFLIRERRKEIKHYGVLFTCLSSRAIHLEVATSLETDAFICALRRFIARRGNVKTLWSDNGTNFVGANAELKKSLQELNQGQITAQLHQTNIEWKFNPPTASNMGGVWERMIRTVRKILNGILTEHSTRLSSDSFHTLLCEVEAIINSRPITHLSNDPGDLEPLTPNHILTLRSTVTVPPPGIFKREDTYLKRRWRQVQALAELFWSRWKREYMVLLQDRPKWNVTRRNLTVGDVVLLKDENVQRNRWPLGLVEDVEADDEGHVRTVTVRTKQGQLRRPSNKLVLLVACERVHVKD